MCQVSAAAHEPSLAAASGGHSGCGVQASHCGGFSGCAALALGCVGFRHCGLQALEHRLRGWGTQASLPCSMWNIPGPGMEPVS